jgi:hypothetical protein
MQLPSTKKRAPGRSCLPPFLYATFVDSDALAYPGTHPAKCTCPKLLARNFSPTRSLLPPPPFGRSLLPTLSSAATRTCKACITSHRASCKPAPSIRQTHHIRPPGHTRQEGTYVVEPGDAELDKVLFLSLLTLHFPSGKALSPSRALATKSRGDPPVNARLLGGPFHWEI